MCHFPTTGCLDLIDYKYTAVRCCTTYEYAFVCTCHVFCAAAALCAVIMPLLQLQCFCLQLLFAIVCLMTQFVAVVCLLHLIPEFFFSSFKHDIFFMYPLSVLPRVQLRLFHNAIICTIHPRELRAFSEPRRAAARHGEAPHLCKYRYAGNVPAIGRSDLDHLFSRMRPSSR